MVVTVIKGLRVLLLMVSWSCMNSEPNRFQITELRYVRHGVARARVCTETRVCTLTGVISSAIDLRLVAPLVVDLVTLLLEVEREGLQDTWTLVLVGSRILRD